MMAKSGSAGDIMQCSICMDAFRMPKYLPCIHTFCLECLEQYGKGERPGDEMPCPICREKFKIPSDGFRKLPNNIFIEQISERLRWNEGGGKGGGEKCDGCDGAETVKYCVDCDQSMCKDCAVRHGKSKASQSHKVVLAKDKEGSQKSMSTRPTHCASHKDKQLDLYCEDCQATICTSCLTARHKNHKCVDLQTSSEKLRQQIKIIGAKLQQSIQSNKGKLKQLDASKTCFLRQVEECERAIEERSAELKRHIDEQCHKLLQQLEKKKNKTMKQIQVSKDEAERQLLLVESLKTYVGEVMSKGSPCVVSQSAKDLLARATELEASEAEFSRRIVSPPPVVFKRADISDIVHASGSRLIGSIDESESAGNGDSDSRMPEFRLLHVIAAGVDNGARSVLGAVVLNTELYVLRTNAQQIDVYNTVGFAPKSSIAVAGMTDPTCLAACQRNNCLYIGHGGQPAWIHRLDLSTGQLSQWSVEGQPRALSATSEGNLLVTLRSINVVCELTSSGRKIREVKLDASIDRPLHAVKLSGDRILVSHSGANEDRVCVVDTTGRIVHSYGGPPGSSIGQLNFPLFLAVDSSRGRVFIADFSNNRVVALSATLTRLGDVTTPGHQMKNPCTLHLDEFNERLYIGELYTGRIAVFTTQRDAMYKF